MSVPPALGGRRVALLDAGDAEVVEQKLTEAGATVERLSRSDSRTLWHSGPYAALLLVGSLPDSLEDKALQLTREFLVADKPIAAHGGAVSLLLTSGGVAGRTIAVDERFGAMTSPAGATPSREDIAIDDSIMTAREGVSRSEFAERAVQLFARLLEERKVDEMSDLSFPASDPPAVSPSSAGPSAPTRDQEPRA